MRVYMKEVDNLYSWVYMLAPLDNTINVKLIWLPNHLQNERNGVNDFELKFCAVNHSPKTRIRWLDGLPELIVNAKGTRVTTLVLKPIENLILIEHDDDWEFHLLIEMARLPCWKDFPDFDILSKLGTGVRANVLK